MIEKLDVLFIPKNLNSEEQNFIMEVCHVYKVQPILFRLY